MPSSALVQCPCAVPPAETHLMCDGLASLDVRHTLEVGCRSRCCCDRLALAHRDDHGVSSRNRLTAFGPLPAWGGMPSVAPGSGSPGNWRRSGTGAAVLPTG